MEFDTIVRGGTVADGTGAPSSRADVGIRGERIAAVGDLSEATAPTIIDATGRVVAPGFIDTHIHSEIALLGFGHRYGSVLQGVTTQLTAPDGFGWARLPRDLAEELWETTQFCYGKADLTVDWPTPQAYLALFPGRSPANVVPQAPHCAIRLGAMGWAPRPATRDELQVQKEALRAWMDAGAVGLSLGLDYQPSAYASTFELTELAKVAGEYGGTYNAHIRGNILGRAGAWRETIEIGKRSGARVHVAHEYVNEVTEPLLEQADQECDLTFESYLYPAGSTHFPQFSMPTWAQQGGERGLRARISEPGVRERVRDHLELTLGASYASGAKQVIAANQTGRYVGMTVEDAASEADESLGDFALRMLDEEQPYTLTINHRPGGPEVHDEMVRQTAQHPKAIVASDGIYHGPHPHPRAFGCHTRVLRLCVRERGFISLESAIHKMTGKPAERFGIADRGVVSAGAFADLVVFDPGTVADRSTWEEPLLEPVGIDCVLVNGQIVVHDGTPTGALPGQVTTRRR
jgi:N-acyl-D-amino-acid deacylase